MWFQFHQPTHSNCYFQFCFQFLTTSGLVVKYTFNTQVPLLCDLHVYPTGLFWVFAGIIPWIKKKTTAKMGVYTHMGY